MSYSATKILNLESIVYWDSDIKYTLRVQDKCLIPWNSIYKMKIRPKTHRPIYNPMVAL